MTIASEITRIKTNIENTYTALEEKGATMPDVQNSANLADTVATVSTGSSVEMRGDWCVPPAYTEMDTLVANATTSNMSTNYILGVYFKDWVNKIYLNPSNVYSYQVQGGEKVLKAQYNVTDDNWIEVQLNENCRYIVIEINLPYSCYDVSLINKCATFGKNLNITKYLTVRKIGTFGSTVQMLQDYKNLDDLKFINCEFYRALTVYDLLKFWASFKYNKPLSDFGSKQPTSITPSSSEINYWINNLATLRHFPVPIDLSARTSSITFGSSSYEYTRRLEHALLKLPAQNVTANQLCLDKESLAYWAENAPEVEGKTITLGEANIVTAGGSDGEIIQAFVTKGWTVS